MSEPVELHRSQYPDDALDRFTPNAQFDFENARAMMWLSQLAYETVHDAKVTEILGAWGLTRRDVITNDPGTGLPPRSACAIVADGRDATFVAFAGSDPLKFNDWVTDFTLMPTPDDLHSGFKAAVDFVWSRVEPAIIDPANAGRPVGLPDTVSAVPWRSWRRRARRTGGRSSPIRLAVHATAAKHSSTTIRRGLAIPRLRLRPRHRHRTNCASDDPRSISSCRTSRALPHRRPVQRHRAETEAAATIRISFAVCCKPGFAHAAAIAALELLPRIGAGLQNMLARFLPRLIRDHIPANYFRALSIAVPNGAAALTR